MKIGGHCPQADFRSVGNQPLVFQSGAEGNRAIGYFRQDDPLQLAGIRIPDFNLLASVRAGGNPTAIRTNRDAAHVVMREENWLAGWDEAVWCGIVVGTGYHWRRAKKFLLPKKTELLPEFT